MNDLTVQAPHGVFYLSDTIQEKPWMTEIPVNCVFNKGVTGCGATTLAIKQPGHTILALPFRGLVENKMASNPNLLGIHGDMNREAAIADYLKSAETIKIAATYDSVPIVCDTLQAQGIDPYKETFLFVDEWHILFNHYRFRNSAVRKLLDRAQKFERKTFVSATPIPREYWLTELQDLPEYKIEWPDAEVPTVTSKGIIDPIAAMARICKGRVKHGGDENYHIFLNSVQGISRIIRLAGLVPEDCRVVCSQSEDTGDRNREKLPPGFSIGSTTGPVKLFNFYTSTCFEGQDILDENGRTFIVSEKYKDHTKMDIQTSLLQICGRIRDSRYRTEITQLYSFSKYKDLSWEEFEADLNSKVAIAEQNAQAYDQLVGAERERLIKVFLPKSPYIGVDGNGRIVMDRNLANYEIVNYNIVNGIYRSQVNMVAALKDAGLNVVTSTEEDEPDEKLESLKSIERTSFKDIFEEYCSLKAKPIRYDLSFRESRIAQEKPLVVEAYIKLGPEKVRQMKYHIYNIKRELVKLSHETQDVKIFLLIDPLLEKGVAIPRSEIKELLEKAYRTLGINYKAKATELKRWYNLRETTKRGKDGKPIACFVVVSAKIKVGQ